MAKVNTQRAVIYARFSSDMQTELSIEAQERACLDYAEKNNINVINRYFDKAVSGKSTNGRSYYQKMMRDAKNDKFDIILVHKYDRLSRNLGDSVNLQAKLNELGIKLIAVAQDFGETKEGRMMRAIQWVLADYYIENLSEETKKGHREIALKGMHNGGTPPFGYDVVNQEYVINPTEAEYVKKMFQCCINKESYHQLIIEMEDKGITGKRGKPIRYSSIYEILRNEKYTGTYVYSPTEEKKREYRRTKPNAIRVENAFPAIIEKDIWEYAQKILDARKPGRQPRRNRCTGLVYCACCGAPMYLNRTKRKGHTYENYVCSKHCGNKIVSADIVEKIVDMYIEKLDIKKIKKQYSKMCNVISQNRDIALQNFEETKKNNIQSKKEEINNITNNISRNVLPDVVLKILSEKIADLQAEIEKIEKLNFVENYTPDTLVGWIEDILNANDERLPSVVISRIEVSQDSASVISTFNDIYDDVIKEPTIKSRGLLLVAGVGFEPTTSGL